MQNRTLPSAAGADPALVAALPVDDVLATCTLTTTAPGSILIRISGELDACSVPALEQQIRSGLDPDNKRLVIDLQEVGFIDSTGIRLLVQLLGNADERRKVVIIKPRSLVARRAIEVVGLARIVLVVDGLDEALDR